MDKPVLGLRGAFEALFRSRGLCHPDGQPLYRYRFTRQEFDGVGEVLRRHGASSLDSPEGSALFVAFVAEWYRRERTGGAWDWIRPLAAIGIRYHATESTADIHYGPVRAAAVNGLRRWHRPVPTNGAVLLGVVREAGFPAAALRESSLGAWLKRSILAIETGFTADEAVRSEAWRAGETLVQALCEPAIDLCSAIADLRRALTPDQRRDSDPVALLASVRPDWLDHLPFEIEERDFRSLVEDLVRVRRDDGGALAAARSFRRDGNDWFAHVELSMSGQLDTRRVSPQLHATLRTANRIRLFPKGALEANGRPVAVLERTHDDEHVVWESRPLVQRFDARLSLGEAVRLGAVSGDAPLVEFTAIAGEPLDAPVVVLEPQPNDDPDTADELKVVGSSPIRSTRPWLALAVREDAVDLLKFENPPKVLGHSTRDQRQILSFSGRVTLDQHGSRLVWRSADERDENKRLVLVGDTLDRVDNTVYRGQPRVWLSEGDHASMVQTSRVLWRPVGNRKWRSAKEHEPLGRVEFAVENKGELSAWCYAEVVPRAAIFNCDPKKRSLTIEGLDGALVAARGATTVYPVDRQGHTATVDLSSHPRGEMLHVALRWEGQLELTMPDPVTEPVLLAPNGQPAHKRELISVGRLHGYRLLASEPHKIHLETRTPGERPLFAVCDVEGLMPLAALEEVFRDLLGSTSNVDGEVRLTWSGQGECFARIAWYDLDEKLYIGAAQSPFSGASRALGWRLTAISLPHPSGGCVDVERDHASNLRKRLASEAGPGPWLLFGTTNNGQVLRPKVLSAEGDTHISNGALAPIMRLDNLVTREAAFKAVLCNTSGLDKADIRLIIELLVAARGRGLPLAAIEVARLLPHATDSAPWILAHCETLDERAAVLRTQNELPFIWCTTPISAWFAAFQHRREALAGRLAALGMSLGDATHSVVTALAQIADLEPSLAPHVRMCVLMLGAHESLRPELAERLGRETGVSLRDNAASLVARQTELPEPPCDLGLWALVADRHDIWDRYDEKFADVMAAPIIAAQSAAGRLRLNLDTIKRCRVAWLHDRHHFETAFAIGLQQAAIS